MSNYKRMAALAMALSLLLVLILMSSYSSTGASPATKLHGLFLTPFLEVKFRGTIEGMQLREGKTVYFVYIEDVLYVSRKDFQLGKNYVIEVIAECDSCRIDHPINPGDRVEVFGAVMFIYLEENGYTGDRLVISVFFKDHYVARLEAKTYTVFKTVTKTVTAPPITTTFISTRYHDIVTTITSTLTKLTTLHTTVTERSTTTITRYATSYSTTTTTLTQTVTVKEPIIVIEKVEAEKTGYRPGEEVSLYLTFRNVGAPGPVRVIYDVLTTYTQDYPGPSAPITRGVNDLGYLDHNQVVKVRAQTMHPIIAAGPDYMEIFTILKEVNEKTLRRNMQSMASTRVDIIVDERIILMPGKRETNFYKITLKKGEVKSILLSADTLLDTTASLITIKRLPTIFDFDEEVEVAFSVLEEETLSCDCIVEGRYSGVWPPYTNYPILLSVNKGWKKFQLTLVDYPCETGAVEALRFDCRPIVYPSYINNVIVESGFRFPWDNSFKALIALCHCLKTC